METAVNRLYEAMFLVDSALAASDWNGVNKTIETILKRADGQIVSIRKWDERRLAYDIDKKSRGTYILCYFRTDGSKISGIERDVRLSERIMRVLILNAEHMTDEDIEKEIAATSAEKQTEQPDQLQTLSEPVEAEQILEPDKVETAEQFTESLKKGAEKLEKPQELEETQEPEGSRVQDREEKEQ